MRFGFFIRFLFTVNGFNDSHKNEYTLEIVDHDALACIVKFVHTGCVTIPLENAGNRVREVLIAAKYLIMNNLAAACEKYMADNITLANCIEVWKFARKHSCLEILCSVSKFLAEHLGSIMQRAEFLALPFEDCGKLLLNEIVITTGNPDVRCRAALAWLHESRIEYADDVVNMILLDAEKISRDTLSEVCNSRLMSASAKGKLMLQLCNVIKPGTVEPMNVEGDDVSVAAPAAGLGGPRFLTSAMANDILGLGPNGKIFKRKPNIKRYAVDREDFRWLVKEGHVLKKGTTAAKTFLIPLAEIEKLLHKYNKERIPEGIIPFRVPAAMLAKFLAQD